ncbi:MAG: alpha/beta hydrolase [Shimia sp.]|nr:alpha/beta hydrolase [Shimia sp.]
MTETASGINWSDAFDNAPYIPAAADFPQMWAARSQAFRQACHFSRLDIAYGTKEREVLDLFLPAKLPRGLVFFVHGGFWKAFDKSYWSFLAQGALDNGMAVAMPSYTLAPDATLPEITQQIARALEKAAAQVMGPIYLAGHSAGGHLVTRTICEDTSLDESIVNRIEQVVSISGLHDLPPLRLHPMNDTLGLTEATALSESAVCHTPMGRARVTAWVGARERPEFLRQSALLAEAWAAAGASLYAEPDRHHFDVIDGLLDGDSLLLKTLLGRECRGEAV